MLQEWQTIYSTIHKVYEKRGERKGRITRPLGATQWLGWWVIINFARVCETDTEKKYIEYQSRNPDSIPG